MAFNSNITSLSSIIPEEAKKQQNDPEDPSFQSELSFDEAW